MNSPFHIYQLSIHFLPFCSYTNTETLYIITKTPGGFPWLYGQFPCLYKGFACGYRAALCTHLFHLPERASHSPDKAPLALHMGFQVFRAFADKPQKPLADSTVSYLHRQNIKRTAETALFSYHHLSIYFYRFTIIQARKLFTLSRKPLYYHENSLSVSVIIQPVSVFV